jgi:hypothetical protein
MNAAVGALLFAIALLGAVGHARSQDWPDEADRAPALYMKQILRLQASEFCATVKPPPAALMTAVQEGAKAGNTDAQIAFMWLLRIQERYQKNGCGDA